MTSSNFSPPPSVRPPRLDGCVGKAYFCLLTITFFFHFNLVPDCNYTAEKKRKIDDDDVPSMNESFISQLFAFTFRMSSLLSPADRYAKVSLHILRERGAVRFNKQINSDSLTSK
jgi:hypothetical protein